ncbi:MAG: hypothetical protein K2O89_00425 [Clostridia bacterium]|nr:hypothetical protein [Clostridia bacterium]
MKVLIILPLLAAIFLCACNSPSYPLKTGAYGFEKAIVTNILTEETGVKYLDDILNYEYKDWGTILSFSVRVDEDTEYVFVDGRCLVINEGVAYEVIGENSLMLHFSRWNANNSIYDVVIYLTWEQTYG